MGIGGEDSRLLLRMHEAAEMLGVSRSFMYELVAKNAIPTITLGRARRVPIASLKAWVNDQVKEQRP